MLALRTASKARSLAPLARAYSDYGHESRSSRFNDRRGPPRDQRRQYDDRRNNAAQAEQRRAAILYQVAKRETQPPPHLLTLADLSVAEVSQLVRNALSMKIGAKKFGPGTIRNSLSDRNIAMIFSKRSTRTRVATETSVSVLGGHPFFLGKDDIQLGVNESLQDSAKVISSMADGIMARVAKHDEVATLAKYSSVPVVNALCDLYHPTQILADLLTLVELYAPQELLDIDPNDEAFAGGFAHRNIRRHIDNNIDIPALLEGKKMAWVGDQNNMTNELMLTLPRFGVNFAIAAPKGYDQVDPVISGRLEAADLVQYTNSPAEALKDADLVVTDTWISMGQEEETAKRLAAFAGYQITNDLVNGAGAKPDWKFLHCLPRHKDEVDDEVFYGERSLVFPEAENRKWTIMAVFDALVGRWEKA